MIPFLCPWKQISMETNFFALGISCFYAKAIKSSEAILMLVLLILQTRRKRGSWGYGPTELCQIRSFEN